jgi:hypothetical protein
MTQRTAKVANATPSEADGRGQPSQKNDRAAAAAYLASMAADLAAIARRRDLEPLAYILDMARLEAEAAVQRFKS